MGSTLLYPLWRCGGRRPVLLLQVVYCPKGEEMNSGTIHTYYIYGVGTNDWEDQLCVMLIRRDHEPFSNLSTTVWVSVRLRKDCALFICSGYPVHWNNESLWIGGNPKRVKDRFQLRLPLVECSDPVNANFFEYYEKDN